MALVLQQRDAETHDWSYHILEDQDRELFHTDMETLFSSHVSAHGATVHILSALAQFFSEKQGWVSRSQLMQTAQGPVLWIDCVYQEGGKCLAGGDFSALQ